MGKNSSAELPSSSKKKNAFEKKREDNSEKMTDNEATLISISRKTDIGKGPKSKIVNEKKESVCTEDTERENTDYDGDNEYTSVVPLSAAE